MAQYYYFTYQLVDMQTVKLLLLLFIRHTKQREIF